jgi:hypothetical protein
MKNRDNNKKYENQKNQPHKKKNEKSMEQSYIYKNIWLYVDIIFLPKKGYFKIRSYTLMFLPQKLCEDSS